MTVPPLHRFLGLAGIYQRLDEQDKTMATLADNATKLSADLAALSGDFDTLEAAVTALKAATPAVGTTVDQATVDAIQSATDGFDALVAKIAAADGASTTSPTTTDASGA